MQMPSKIFYFMGPNLRRKIPITESTDFHLQRRCVLKNNHALQNLIGQKKRKR